ncbi:MAG: FkbM family methyltransferase [Sediminibacterium sp.]
MRRGNYERSFRHFISLIPNEGVLLDIGANIGMMTVYMARKLDRVTVFAFEPIPANVKALKRIVTFFKLGNVKVFEIALGDKPGSLKMVLPIVNHSRMQGWCHVTGFDEGKYRNKGEVYDVPAETLNGMKALKDIPKITAIKIDVENFEYYVLKGGDALLAKHKPLIYAELWDDEKRQWCIDLLQQLGYEVKVFSEDQLDAYYGQPALDFFFLPLYPAAASYDINHL